jgi:salicylate hydroxylase/6-hydroxynicotinate 3-monooxygenase
MARPLSIAIIGAGMGGLAAAAALRRVGIDVTV